jgi:hypothetical protein
LLKTCFVVDPTAEYALIAVTARLPACSFETPAMPRRCPFLALLLVALAVPSLSAGEPAKLLPPDRPIEQVVDHHIDAGLKEANVAPAAAASDAELLRRLSLDLNGRIATVAEMERYLADANPQKKLQLVDRLFASPCFIRHQATEFTALLQADDGTKKPSKKSALQDYFLQAFAENRSWDRIFREVMLPDDADPKMKGAGEFLKSRVKDLNRLTIDVSTLFFGVNVSCAQCHDHPHVPDWTQDHFYGMKSFFARTFDSGGILAEYDAGVVKYIPNKGQEKAAPAMFLTGKKLELPNLREPTKEEKKKVQELIAEAKKTKKTPPAPEVSARAKLVETALEPGQRDFFARAAVNRLWYRFFGRGLVMPLDQMHSENPASHPELLEWLARDLIDHGYDLRRLARGLVLSNAYARSSRWEGEKAPPDNLFAVARARPLTPMQMALSLRLATTDPQTLPVDSAELEKRLEALEKGAESLAALFPRPADNFQVGVSEAMLFANNQALQKELLEGKETLATRMVEVPGLVQRAELAVRTVLGRPPQGNELKVLTEYLRRREERPLAGCQQVVWALVTSAEFRFNH